MLCVVLLFAVRIAPLLSHINMVLHMQTRPDLWSVPRNGSHHGVTWRIIPPPATNKSSLGVEISKICYPMKNMTYLSVAMMMSAGVARS
jgi:hypothetical protein